MRITSALFHVSDLFAYLLAGLAAFVALAFPVAAPILARMDKETISVLEILFVSGMWSIVAVGAWSLTRRRALGLCGVALPAVLGNVWFSMAYLAAVALVFGLPLLLALLEARHRLRRGEVP